MQAWLLSLIAALIASAASAQQSAKPRPIVQRTTPLEAAYRARSTEQLTQFFRGWSESLPAISAPELAQLNERQQEAYGVFTSFYKPHRLDSLGGSEWGNDIYQQTSFLLVQNELKIRVTDRLFYSDAAIDSIITAAISRFEWADSTKQRHLKKVNGRLTQQVREEFGFGDNFSYHNPADPARAVDSLLDFRPRVKAPGKQIIYLTPARAETLRAFLRDKHLPLGAGGIMNPARSRGESEKRKTFLGNDIKIWYGHWGGYWQLNSYPVASSITFDKSMNYARVNFRMVYEGGEAILKKTDGQWRLLTSKITWIE